MAYFPVGTEHGNDWVAFLTERPSSRPRSKLTPKAQFVRRAQRGGRAKIARPTDPSRASKHAKGILASPSQSAPARVLASRAFPLFLALAVDALGRQLDLEVLIRSRPDTLWREYEFPAKPGDVNRRPAGIAPYQPRLDWALWFAAMSTPERYPWTLHLVAKLLCGDRGTLALLANDPFPDRPPHFIRARLYRYEFVPSDDASGAWWKRTLLGEWLPPLALDDDRLVRPAETLSQQHHRARSRHGRAKRNISWRMCGNTHSSVPEGEKNR